MGVNIGLVLWFATSGSEAHLAQVEPISGPPTISAPNPGLPGTYEVETLFYGSGTDERRPEYGEEVDLVTEPVDASSFVTMDGFNEKVRRWYWEFG